MTRTRVALAVAVSVICVGGASAAIAASVATPPVPSQYKGINDPKLLACQQTHVVCNKGAQSWKEIAALPVSKPAPHGAKIISLARAEYLARHMALGNAAESAAAVLSAPARGLLLSGSQAMGRFHFDRSNFINEGRPVWIITVRATVRTDGVARVWVKHYYSAVIDAITGSLTDDCLGCDWVPPSG